MSYRVQSIKKQISEIERSLGIIEVRKTEYVSQTAIPLELIKDEQLLVEKRNELQAELVALSGAARHKAEKLQDTINPRAGLGLKLIITIIIFIIAVAAGLFIWHNYKDKPPVRERILSYWVLAQQYRNKKSIGEPIRLFGSEISADASDELQFFFTSMDVGHLYLLGEDVVGTGTQYNLIFPTPKVNNSSSSIQTNVETATDKVGFDGQAATEKLWIIWTASPIAEIETEIARGQDPTYLGEIKEKDRVASIKNFLEQNSKMDIQVHQDEANQRTVLKGRGDKIIKMLRINLNRYLEKVNRN
ncbi:MAG TPA: hypothetical protein VNI02_07340 [Blastocatellia bacterium]|nr:hypothetical protein [Blastocatellia bacterium]